MLSSALLLTTNSGSNTSIHKLTVGKDTNADAYGITVMEITFTAI